MSSISFTFFMWPLFMFSTSFLLFVIFFFTSIYSLSTSLPSLCLSCLRYVCSHLFRLQVSSLPDAAASIWRPHFRAKNSSLWSRDQKHDIFALNNIFFYRQKNSRQILRLETWAKKETRVKKINLISIDQSRYVLMLFAFFLFLKNGPFAASF